MNNILIIDNYDSFTYNLVHLVEQFAEEVEVVRNDVVDLSKIEYYSGIILSPGPGLPENAGKLMEVIHHYHRNTKILGICLGHQAIATYFGGILFNLPVVAHGISTEMVISSRGNAIFKNIPLTVKVGRYHSWAVSCDNFPECLIIDAFTVDKIIMALHHKYFPVYGLQFHPESVLSEYGATMIKNWIQL